MAAGVSGVLPFLFLFQQSERNCSPAALLLLFLSPAASGASSLQIVETAVAGRGVRGERRAGSAPLSRKGEGLGRLNCFRDLKSLEAPCHVPILVRAEEAGRRRCIHS